MAEFNADLIVPGTDDTLTFNGTKYPVRRMLGVKVRELRRLQDMFTQSGATAEAMVAALHEATGLPVAEVLDEMTLGQLRGLLDFLLATQGLLPAKEQAQPGVAAKS